MASPFKSSKEFRELMDRTFQMMSEDPQMGPSLRDADVPQRFEFEDLDLVMNIARQAGFDVQNQLSVLDPEQRDAVEVMIRKGGARGEGEPVKPAPVPTPPVVSIPRDGGETKVVLKPHAHYSPARNPGIERLLDVGEKAGFEELEKIASVAEVDTECAMFKIRKLTERLCCVLLKQTLVDNLNDAITEIIKQKVLGKKVGAYLDQIRKVANLAVHGSDDLFDSQFSMTDVNIAADALACVIEESLSRSLIRRK